MKTKLTIYIDDDITSLLEAESNESSKTISQIINKLVKDYYRQRLNSDVFYSNNFDASLGNIEKLIHQVYKQIAFTNYMITGGLPIFPTNTDTKILRPTELLKKEAKRKMLDSYSNLLKGEMSKEDYFAESDGDNNQ